MERVYAFTDESGAFGWNLTNPSVSTTLIISAVIVKESDLEEMRQKVGAIRSIYFQTGEIKSSHIGQDHKRRRRILADCLSLPFSILTVVIDKTQLIDQIKGLRYKSSFYKFCNNIVHKELRRPFTKLTIVADEIGGSDYMKSFSSYVAHNQDVATLLGEADFTFESSQSNVLIQLADLIAGTFACEYDAHKKTENTPAYHKLLEKKIIRTEFYPKSYATYIIENSALAEGYDSEIATLCFKLAVDFIHMYENDLDIERKCQIIILQYLLFRFMNNDLRAYISTRELIAQLSSTELSGLSTQTFRTRIIGKLRDSNVIISGSSAKKGYKIPSKTSELYDFINHGTSIIVPMLERLKKCRDIIKLGTLNELDLFDQTEYSSLKKYFDE